MEGAAERGIIDLSGTWRAAPGTESLRRDAILPELDDDAWTTLDVPGHWRSSPAFADHDGPVLYRHRFEAPTDAAPAWLDAPAQRRRSWLVLDGVLYTSDVWLDGAYLGDTEGYFFPHGFEVTDQLGAVADHTLAVEVACERPSDPAAKRNLTGELQHAEGIDPAWNPGGIWRPVRIERSGPIRIRHSRAVCRSADERVAVIALRAVLDAAEATTVTLRTEVAGGRDVRDQPLAAGENRVEWTVDVPEPQRWWPWSLGDQPLHDLVVDVVDDDGSTSDRLVRRIGLRSVELHDWVLRINGERLFCKGVELGPTDRALGDASGEQLRGDVALARHAGLDLVRVRAHVSRPELYDAADELGMLVWQDMPLQWGYHRSVRRQARRQARELVDLLGHHPSIHLWCGHNEPLAVDVEPEALADPARRRRSRRRRAAAQVLPTWNRTVLDGSIRRVLEHTDGSRPVIPHSGVLPHPPQLDGTDSHLGFGWRYGDDRDLATTLRRWPRLARFVSVLAPQAVPDDDAFCEPDRWPEVDWGRLGRHHGLQLDGFARYVPPGEHATWAEWRSATQAHQATVVRRSIEALRRIKYHPTGGFTVACLGDAQPAVSSALLDHERTPKLAWGALQAACAPVIVVADRLPEVVRPGDQLDLDVHVVSDERDARPDATVTARLSWRPRPSEGAAPSATGASEPGEAAWAWQGDIPADGCVRVGSVGCTLPASSAGCELVLDLELTGGRVSATNRYTADVAVL